MSEAGHAAPIDYGRMHGMIEKKVLPVSNREYAGLHELQAVEQAMPNYNRFIVGLFLHWADQSRRGIVDFGAGIGTLSALIQTRCGMTPICVEPDPTLRRILAARDLPAVADLDDVTAAFDIVFSSNVLEHIADDRACLARLHDKLPAGGGLFLFVPAFQVLWTQLDVDVGHYRRYTRRELINKVTAAGFVIQRCRYADSLGFFVVLTWRLLGRGGVNAVAATGRLAVYDRFVLPLSRLLDWFGVGRLFGKNLILYAEIPRRKSPKRWL